MGGTSGTGAATVGGGMLIGSGLGLAQGGRAGPIATDGASATLNSFGSLPVANFSSVVLLKPLIRSLTAVARGWRRLGEVRLHHKQGAT